MRSVHRLIWIALAVVSLAAQAPRPAQAQSVIRGPYLQLGTPDSVVVRWRTDVATDGRVSYGSAPGSLTSTVDDPFSKTEHEVTLSKLLPDKQYYYAVGTTTRTLAGNDASHFFFTAPTPGTPKPIRIWALGDSGTADSGARAVRDAYYAFTGTRHTNLWLMLGDNAYSDGTDSEFQAAVFNMYPTMLRKSVLWPTLGNHDGHSADSGTQSGPYYNIFTLPRNGEAGGLASGTEAYYSFDYGNIHFIVLDSFDSPRSPGGAMLTWLRQDLAATTQDWIIAFWHHPPYSKGSHNSDTETGLKEMRENALPLLEEGGVDLVLAGHSHSYERSFLLDSHYGTSDTLAPSMILNSGDGRPTGNGAYEKPTQGPAPHEGAVYTVAGSSGHTSGGSLNHPVMFISLNVLGSLVLDVAGNRMDAVFLDSTGVNRDYFTIVKNASSGPSTVTISASDPTATEAGPTTGTFTLTRTGSTVSGLTVNYGLSGSAINGSDYVTLSGSATIPAGSSTGAITVTPIDDSLVEANETVVVTLNPNAAYTVGSPSSATVTIIDNDTTASTTLAASPATIAAGGTMTATWSGIATPTSTDWIALYQPGTADTAYLGWIYVSCSQAAGSPRASGSCPFVVPASLASGTYELRLFANGSFTRLATSNSFAVTASTTLAASPATIAAGGTMTATWSGIVTPTSTDWIALYQPGTADTAYLGWIYVSCSQAAGSPRASGSCPFVVPASLASGTYELRLFANGSFTRLATSNGFTVTP